MTQLSNRLVSSLAGVQVATASRGEQLWHAILKPMTQDRAAQKEPLTSTKPSVGAILAIDYGRARFGLALADAETRLPRPLATLERVNRNEDMRRLREVIRQHSVRQLVVGLPLRLDGTRGEMAEEATRFAARASKQFGLPVEMIDERLTSWEAERLLEEQAGRVLHDNKPHSKAKKQERASVDSVAAAVILKEYLDRQGATKDSRENI